MRIKIAIAALAATTMCIAAFGAAGASATSLEECGGAGVQTPETCFEAGKLWTKVPANTKLKQTGVGASTLKATVAGVEFEVKCLSQSGEATASNTGEGAKSQIKGTGKTEYSECEVLKPTGGVCTVEQPIKTAELKSETILETMKDKYEPVAEKGAFVTLNILGASCPAALKGGKNVTGSATAEGNAEGSEESFTATSGSELKFGGQAATFLSIIKFDTKTTPPIPLFSRTP